MFNKLLEKGELKYTFADKGKQYLFTTRRLIN